MTGPAWLIRHRRGFAVLLVEAVIATSAAVLLLAAVPELDRLSNGGPASSQQPTASGPGSATGSGLTPIMVAMGPDADCGACHLSPDGGVGILKIPTIAHPLNGWRDCTACHADDRLVKTAPGHTSLHKTDCLVCHEAPVLSGSPPPRPHPLVAGQACLSCHDSHKAPLPSGMAGRENCWLCHSGTEFQGLFASPAPSASTDPP